MLCRCRCRRRRWPPLVSGHFPHPPIDHHPASVCVSVERAPSSIWWLLATAYGLSGEARHSLHKQTSYILGLWYFFFLVVSSCFSRVGALFSEAIVMDIGSQMSIVDERNPHTKEETN